MALCWKSHVFSAWLLNLVEAHKISKTVSDPQDPVHLLPAVSCFFSLDRSTQAQTVVVWCQTSARISSDFRTVAIL